MALEEVKSHCFLCGLNHPTLSGTTKTASNARGCLECVAQKETKSLVLNPWHLQQGPQVDSHRAVLQPALALFPQRTASVPLHWKGGTPAGARGPSTSRQRSSGFVFSSSDAFKPRPDRIQTKLLVEGITKVLPGFSTSCALPARCRGRSQCLQGWRLPL